MKLVKKFVITVLFVSALAINTNAGDLETPGFVPPPPPQNHSLMADAGEPTTEENNQITDYTIQDQLFYDALVTMLSLF